jgi:hypothetical protein
VPTSSAAANILTVLFVQVKHTLVTCLKQGGEYEAFKKVATKTEDVPFVETTSAAVAKAAGLAKPGVVAIQNFKGKGSKPQVYQNEKWVGLVGKRCEARPVTSCHACCKPSHSACASYQPASG